MDDDNDDDVVVFVVVIIVRCLSPGSPALNTMAPRLSLCVQLLVLACLRLCAAQFGSGISGLPEQGNPILVDAPSQRVGHTITPISKEKVSGGRW